MEKDLYLWDFLSGSIHPILCQWAKRGMVTVRMKWRAEANKLGGDEMAVPNDEDKLTAEAKQAIRSYMLSLFVVPTVIIAIASGVFGYLVNGLARYDALEKLVTTIEQSDQAANKASASAESADKALKAAYQTSKDVEKVDDQAKKVMSDIQLRDDNSVKLEQEMKTRASLDFMNANLDKIADTLANNDVFREKVISVALSRIDSVEKRFDGLTLEAVPRDDLAKGSSCRTSKTDPTVQADPDPKSLLVMSGYYSGVGCNVSDVHYFKQLKLVKPPK